VLTIHIYFSYINKHIRSHINRYDNTNVKTGIVIARISK